MEKTTGKQDKSSQSADEEKSYVPAEDTQTGEHDHKGGENTDHRQSMDTGQSRDLDNATNGTYRQSLDTGQSRDVDQNTHETRLDEKRKTGSTSASAEKSSIALDAGEHCVDVDMPVVRTGIHNMTNDDNEPPDPGIYDQNKTKTAKELSCHSTFDNLCSPRNHNVAFYKDLNSESTSVTKDDAESTHHNDGLEVHEEDQQISKTRIGNHRERTKEHHDDGSSTDQLPCLLLQQDDRISSRNLQQNTVSYDADLDPPWSSSSAETCRKIISKEGESFKYERKARCTSTEPCRKDVDNNMSFSRSQSDTNIEGTKNSQDSTSIKDANPETQPLQGVGGVIDNIRETKSDSEPDGKSPYSDQQLSLTAVDHMEQNAGPNSKEDFVSIKQNLHGFEAQKIVNILGHEPDKKAHKKENASPQSRPQGDFQQYQYNSFTASAKKTENMPEEYDDTSDPKLDQSTDLNDDLTYRQNGRTSQKNENTEMAHLTEDDDGSKQKNEDPNKEMSRLHFQRVDDRNDQYSGQQMQLRRYSDPNDQNAP